MKTVWVVIDYFAEGHPEWKGIFATRAAAEAWREQVAESERARARADGWVNTSSNALRWDVEEHEVNE